MHTPRFGTLREIERLLAWLVNGPPSGLVKPLLQGLLWCYGRVERMPTPRLSALGQGLQWDVTLSVVPRGQVADMAEVLELGRKLWAGHAGYALPALERISVAPLGMPRVQALAAWQAARWYMAQGSSHELVLSYLVLARRLHAVRVWQPGLIAMEVDVLVSLDRFDQARELLAFIDKAGGSCSDWHLAQANLLLAEEQDDEQRLAQLNAMLARHELQPLARRDERQPLALANLAGGQPSIGPSTESRPLVSVLMPCFRCADTVETAIRSLLAQSWQALEILPVDDASDDATWQVLNRLAAEDSRVRPLRHEHNQGAYTARLTALAEARGELVTVHDADDWSHPQKLALQVQALLAAPKCKASISSWCRVSESMVLRLGISTPDKGYVTENQSSLMFRRSLVDDIGAWDRVRAGADTEYIWRIRAAFGKNAIVAVKPDVPLSFSLQHDASLTRTGPTHVRTMFHGSRRIYREAQAWWHRTAGRAAFRALPCEPGDRPFFAPPQLLEKAPAAVECELVVVADLCEASPERQAVEQLVRESALTQRVALFHWRHYGSPAMQPIRDVYQAMAAEGRAVIIGPQDRVRAPRVRVVGALMARHRLDEYPQWQCERVVVDEAGLDTMTEEERMTADEHLCQAFGIQAQWPSGSPPRRQESGERETQA